MVLCDDIWEFVDVDVNVYMGDLVEYKMFVLYNNNWIEFEWNKG